MITNIRKFRKANKSVSLLLAFLLTFTGVIAPGASYDLAFAEEASAITHEIVNPGFETGNLDGWTVAEGEAPGRVTSDVVYWHKDPVNKAGEYHFWGDDFKAGVLESTHFQLGGTGEINFLIGGGNLADTQYVALVRESDGVELIKSTHTAFADTEGYHRVVWDASAYLGEHVFIRIADKAAAGGWQHVNADDFHVYNTEQIDIVNAGFEEGNFNGWTTGGEAFTVSNEAASSEGQAYGHSGNYHASAGADDERSGTLTSSVFKLFGSGEIDFLIGGSNDLNGQYVELVREDSGETVFKATGSGSDRYKRIVWNAEAYLGKKLFIRIVDSGAGHVNADDFHVQNKNKGSYTMLNEDFERNGLESWVADGDAFTVAEGNTAVIPGYQRHVYAQSSIEGVGSLTSSIFRLAGSGQVNFKLAGDNEADLYVALYRAGNNIELKRVASSGKNAFETVEWDLSPYMDEQLYFKVVDQSTTGRLYVDDFNYYVSATILNPNFETGDLRGWQVIEGNAFDNVVTNEALYHGTKSFQKEGTYHLWGYQGGGDGRKGTLESAHFILEGDKHIAGDGRVTFLIGGGNKPQELAVQLVQDSTGDVLFSATGHEDEKYIRADWDATAYAGEELFFRIVDKSGSGFGHMNVDDFRTVTPFVDMLNYGFETGDLTGWTQEGDAFKQAVSSAPGFGQEGAFHLYGKAAGDDSATGSLQSRNFELAGTGKVTFLIAGGQDQGKLYAALVRAGDGEILFRASGSDSDIYREVTWDAAAYVGELVYVKIIDEKTEGPYGYISVDDFNLSSPDSYYGEKYRQQYHMSPEKAWMNDPNGMVYYEGEYHLFYQHHPNAPTFGPMTWGHAVSKDLIHWEHLPIALRPGDNGVVFSGSAVVDRNNTSGFFDEEGSGLVAVFTHADNKIVPGKNQVQSIAYSKDKGRTWTEYSGNPVLLPTANADFRDPKVFWHEPTSKWIMSLAVQDRVEFYTSPNLKNWTYASSFGQDAVGSHKGIYECPDLFEISVDGDPAKKKWVLMLSVGDSNGTNPNDPLPPAGGSGMMYFLGNFDGETFTPDQPVLSAADLNWVDMGSDFYAAVTWSDAPSPEGRRLWLGWMSNWSYAGNTPTGGWRGGMSLPRELELKTFPEGIRLIQKPVEQLAQLREPVVEVNDAEVNADSGITGNISGTKMEIVAEFELGNASEFGFKVRKSETEETVIGYDTAAKELFVDRTKSGNTGFHANFAAKHEAALLPENNRIKMHLFVDASSVEVFGNDGRAVISDLIFPDPESTGLELYAADGDVRVVSMKIYNIKSIWKNEQFTKIRLDDRDYSLNAAKTHQTAVYAVSVSENVYEYGAPMTDVSEQAAYQSSNAAVATVNSKGTVTGISAGTTVITATYGGYKAAANVTVVGGADGGTNPGQHSNVHFTKENGEVKLLVSTKRNDDGIAQAVIGAEQMRQALEVAMAGEDGNKKVIIELSRLDGAEGYAAQLPAAYVSSEVINARFELRTPLGTVTLASSMLQAEDVKGTDTVTFTVSEAGLSGVNDEIRSLVGDRPAIDLSVTIGGKPINWHNEDAPVTISLDYTPAANELNDAEHIAVLYIEAYGKAAPVRNGRYNAESGKVEFTITHFSIYAVAFIKASFPDLGRYPWAKKQIEVLASRGIINGVSKNAFNPGGYVTRGDFMMLLVNTLELKADANDGRFNDVNPGDYYDEELAIARALGIATGSGGNVFHPKSIITRQDMMVLTARALKAAGKLGTTEAADLSGFKDAAQVSSYAGESVSLMVNKGIIQGNQGNLNPRDAATRAEAAVMMYKVWALQP